MHIAVIGGREKNEVELVRIAAEAGHELELHDGHVAGRGADTIGSMIARADVVVIVTGINSHGAMFLAKRAARQHQTPTLIVRKFTGARLHGLIAAWQRRELNTWLAESRVASSQRAVA
jgi:hypothetical protein